MKNTSSLRGRIREKSEPPRRQDAKRRAKKATWRSSWRLGVLAVNSSELGRAADSRPHGISLAWLQHDHLRRAADADPVLRRGRGRDLVRRDERRAGLLAERGRVAEVVEVVVRDEDHVGARDVLHLERGRRVLLEEGIDDDGRRAAREAPRGVA